MKAAVLHVNPSRWGARIPTMIIAQFVAEELKIPLIYSAETAAAFAKTKFDVLFVKYGVLKFCDHRDLVMQIYANAKRIINLENDYSFAPDSRLRKLNPSYEVWGTVPANATHHLNWNKAAWVHDRDMGRGVIDGLFYYGAFRAGRTNDLLKYLAPGVPYDVTISCYGKNTEKFKAACPNATIVGRFPVDEFGFAKTTIYIEDEASHALYCSPAQRFYECLQHGVAMAIDESAAHTLEQSGHVVESRWVVGGAVDVQRFLKRTEKHATEQHELWYRDYHKELRSELRKVAKRELAI